MADDVSESWEELCDDQVLERKLQRIAIQSESSQSMNSSRNSNDSGSSMGRTTILKRPSNGSNGSAMSDQQQQSPLQSHSPMLYNGRRSGEMNADSKPFVPRIALECDNPRTQFVPSIKILKRQTGSKNGNGSNGSDDSMKERQNNMKSYEERAAEYAKARERILGSAEPVDTTPIPSLNSPPQLTSPSNDAVRRQSPLMATPLPISKDNVKPEVPTVRQPTAPDGSRGFTRR